MGAVSLRGAGMSVDNAPERALYVQYGAGASGPSTWLNFDASPTLRLQRLPGIGRWLAHRMPAHRPRFSAEVVYGDIVAGLPVGKEQCRAIYCSHVLEHLAYEECRVALRNTWSYLQPGGIFRFVMPDLRGLAEAYLADPQPDAAHRFMDRTYLGRRVRPRTASARMFSGLGNADHLWMWDFASVESALSEAGFVDIRRAQYGDSSERRFAEVEVSSRWEEEGFMPGTVVACLGVECRRAG